MKLQAGPAFQPSADKLVSGDVHLLLVVGEIASHYAVEYGTALDWVLDYIQIGEWAVSRRYMHLETLSALGDDPVLRLSAVAA